MLDFGKGYNVAIACENRFGNSFAHFSSLFVLWEAPVYEHTPSCQTPLQACSGYAHPKSGLVA